MMHPFTSPRVIVIDDEPEAAMPIIRALSALNIPMAWYTGVGNDVPNKPLSNVRVLILDLVLGTATFEPKNTAGVVLRSIAPTLTSGPCLFLLWTAHSDEKESFEKALNSYNQGLSAEERVIPLATICLPKADYIQDSGADGSALIARIENELNTLAPFNLLLEWEAVCAEGAALTAGHLASLAFRWAGEEGDSGEKLGKILDELVKVGVGKAAPEDRASPAYLSALFEPLSLIHDDRTRRLNGPKDGLSWTDILPNPLDQELALAGLNHILLVGPTEESDIPGAVLPIRGANIPGIPFEVSAENPVFQQFLHCVFDPNKLQGNSDVIKETSNPVIVELTPACDFAQAKRERLRFVVGILWPKEKATWIKKAGYLQVIGPLFSEKKSVILVLDCLHFFSLPKDIELPPPLFRLRSHVRADLQAWVGGHLARPGHLSM